MSSVHRYILKMLFIVMRICIHVLEIKFYVIHKNIMLCCTRRLTPCLQSTLACFSYSKLIPGSKDYNKLPINFSLRDFVEATLWVYSNHYYTVYDRWRFASWTMGIVKFVMFPSWGPYLTSTSTTPGRYNYNSILLLDIHYCCVTGHQMLCKL